MLGLTPKRPDSSNFMANGNNIEKGARGMEMFPTLKGIRRSVPTVLKVIVGLIKILISIVRILPYVYVESTIYHKEFYIIEILLEKRKTKRI